VVSRNDASPSDGDNTRLVVTLPKTLQLKTLDFLQQTFTMNENAQWQMIKDSVLFALSLGFFVSFLFEKKSTRGVLFYNLDAIG
jgi:hypothetical protein